ncbi:MAG TPA: DUF4124 domain-containing protein [Casimicrobiaceae bacterium]|nr:DUF4124 domain-containing protein [Casimicrobiaceae bacterium]
MSASNTVRLRKCAAALVAFGFTNAGAHVFKCVDKSGHTTYQQSPCGGGQQGGTVELKESISIRPAGNEAVWSTAAREQRVVVGMPKPFVIEALGAPGEIRAPRSGEAGSEVWVYARPKAMTRLGFLNNAVGWIRSDVPTGDRSPAQGMTAPAPPSATDREARIREALAVGRTCTAALADAGAPDREEPLSAGTLTGARYVYNLDPANANAISAFVCLNGRVTSVERFTPARAGN